MTDEQSSGVSLSRRKVLAGLGAVGAAGAASGVGTFALFSDTASSAGNSVQAGTIDLVLENHKNGTYSQAAQGTFGLSNGKPGDTFGGSIHLHNAGSLQADHAQMRFDASYMAPDGSNGTRSDALAMADQFGVGTFNYPKDSATYGQLTKSGLKDGKDGLLTLRDLIDKTNDSVLNNLTPPPQPNGSQTLAIGFKWLDDATHPSIGSNNAFQGATLNVTVTFALAQKPGQHVLQ